MLFHFHQALEGTAGRTATALMGSRAGPLRECPPAAKEDLQKAVAFRCFSVLCESIERKYGESGARGILERCGRAALFQTLHSTEAIVGPDRPRLFQPSGSDRIGEGLESAVRLLRLVSAMECRAGALPQGYRFHIADRPECMGRRSGQKIHRGAGGMLRGARDWIGIDPAVPVSKILCAAGGADGCDVSIAGAF